MGNSRCDFTAHKSIKSIKSMIVQSTKSLDKFLSYNDRNVSEYDAIGSNHLVAEGNCLKRRIV